MPRAAAGGTRALHGLFCVDKPRGATSATVCAQLRRALLAAGQSAGPRGSSAASSGRGRLGGRGGRGGIYGVNGKLKLGHGGTLDPFATGVLVIGVGYGTKRLGDYQGNGIADRGGDVVALEEELQRLRRGREEEEVEVEQRSSAETAEERDLLQQIRLLKLARKTYECRLRLGQRTDTLDVDGTVTGERPFGHVTEDGVRRWLQRSAGAEVPEGEFPGLGVGRALQLPPAVSALRVGGKRLYQLARKGALTDHGDSEGAAMIEDSDVRKAETLVADLIAPRDVRVYRLELLSFAPPFVDIRVECGHGFYVRRLCDDLGLALGTFAHAVELRRTHQGAFSLKDALTPDQWSIESISAARRAVRG